MGNRVGTLGREHFQLPLSDVRRVPTAPGIEPGTQSGNSYVFGSSAVSQVNDYCFARERESFLFSPFFFFALTREKKIGCFFVFFGVFVLLVFCLFVFRALARFFGCFFPAGG